MKTINVVRYCILGVSLILSSCSKEEISNPLKPDFPKKNTNNSFLVEYEFYSTPENAEEILDSFIEEDQTQQEYGINNSIWLLEGSLNYFFRHKPFTFESHQILTLEAELDLNSEGKINGSSLKQIFSGLKTECLAIIDGENVAFHVADVSVTAKSTAKVNVVINYVIAYHIIWINGSLPVTATMDRHNFDSTTCNSIPMSNNGAQYIAQLGYNKLYNASGLPVYKYHYGLNVRTLLENYGYPSSGGIDGSFLYHRKDDSHFPYGGTVACQEIAELHIYRDQVFNDVSSILTSKEDILLLKLNHMHYFMDPTDPNSWNYYNYHHSYDKVKVGEILFTTQGEPSVWY